jgi:hypothetical protein
MIKDYKKKYEETNKKLTAAKNKLSEVESKVLEQQKLL